MRIVLVVFAACFIALCGWLIVQSALVDGLCAPGPCLLLQKTTTTNASQTAETPPSLPQRSQPVRLTARGGPARRVVLGAADPNTQDPTAGFKFQVVLNSRGAAIERTTFSNGRGKGFDNRDPKNPRPLTILAPVGGDILSLANGPLVLVGQQQQLDLRRLSWNWPGQVERDAHGVQTAQFEARVETEDGLPVLRLTKRYAVRPGSFLLDCVITVENLSPETQKIWFDVVGPTGIGRESYRGDMRKVVGAFITEKQQVVSARKQIQGSFFSRKPGLKKATKQYLEALQSGNADSIQRARRQLTIRNSLPRRHKLAPLLWTAVTNKYFAAILRPVPDGNAQYCPWAKEAVGLFYNPDRDDPADSGDESVGFELRTAVVQLPPAGLPQSTRNFAFQLYVGPKDKDLFDKNPPYRKLGFAETIDFMSCCCPASIIRPLAFGILALMKWMHGFIGNYGVVIIILVFVFRLVIHPITKKSQVSMSKMSKLAPQIEQIRKKYANDKIEMNRQVMALYRQHGATPIMGMLPMMLQMPIWIALWSAVYTSIDLRGAAFLPFWITDLSAPDALFSFSAVKLPLFGTLDSFNLLPILMGVAFYLQQRLMPTQPSAQTNPQMAQQQKMMMIMFPLLFPLMLYKAPSGVNLYIMASTFAGVIEQYVIRKHIREKEQADQQGLVPTTAKTGGKPKKKKPKPFIKKF